MSNTNTAIVTGGARGIGLAIARRLAQDGYAVAIADIDLPTAEAAAAALREAGYPALALQADVTQPADATAMVQAVVERWGRLNVLVNNAGIAGRNQPFTEVTLAEWNQVLNIDLTGVFLCSQAAVRAMLPQGAGRIVNIASIAGKEGNPGLQAYAAAKAGVIGLTKSMGKELAKKGILVNAIAPAVIETEILQQVTPEMVQYMLDRVPMGRFGKPEEVAELVAWLVSPACSFSTGAVYDLSGGRAVY